MTQPTFVRYLVAVGAVILATAVRMLLDPLLGDRNPNATFLIAIVCTAWYGGVGPALTAAILGFVSAAYFFIPPRDSILILGFEQQFSQFVYVCVALFTATLSGMLRNAQRLASASQVEAANQNDLLNVTLGSIGDGVISTDDAGRIVFLNRVAHTLTGWTQEQAVGRPLADVYRLCDQVARVELAAFFAFKPRQSVVPFRVDETVVMARDGSQRIVEHDLSPIRGDRLGSAGAVLVFRDVSRRKRNELVLRFLANSSIALSESLDLESTLSTVARLPIPVFADWCIVELAEGPLMQHMFVSAHCDPDLEGVLAELDPSRDPATNGEPRTLLTATNTELVAAATDDTPREGSFSDRQLACFRQLQTRSWITVPLVGRAGTMGAIRFGVAAEGRGYSGEDVAWAEDFACRAATSLENAQLYQGSRDAERRKDEFMAVLAHELRNPLVAFRCGLHLWKLAPAPSPADRSSLEDMEHQVVHLMRLVDDLFEMSRVTVSKVSLIREKLDLCDIIRRAAVTNRAMIDAQQCKLLLDLPDEPVIIDGDPIRLSQVIVNLIDNAAKYSEKEGRIWVSCAAREAEVRVRDEGIGMAPEIISEVFEPFTRASSESAQRRPGLGIGLSVVRSLVISHGGSVTATSPGLGQGCELVVRLPLATGTLEKPAGAVEIPAAAQRPHLKVLVVDDNVPSARSLAALLRYWNYGAEVASDATSAIKSAEWLRPDVVLLDIVMPSVDGYELARQLHKLLPKAVLVAISGQSQRDDDRNAPDCGIDHHFLKPVAPDVLERLLLSLRPPDPSTVASKET